MKNSSFMVINIGTKQRGLLSLEKNREVVVSVNVKECASESDNQILMEEIRQAYISYLRRVRKSQEDEWYE